MLISRGQGSAGSDDAVESVAGWATTSTEMHKSDVAANPTVVRRVTSFMTVVSDNWRENA
jgi:hypothetical protein